MSVSGIESVGFTPYVAPSVSPAAAARTSGGQEFGDLVLDGLDRLESVQDRSDALAVKAATGDLTSIHDYTIAASEAQVTTQLTVAIRNKAVEAFTEIMRMQV
ncbi:flagellar hook-basal body complex protein FliE [Nocardioides marmoriginsengisoli]|uniref:Flagellar hook-basal body complex protein FliE n=2 Tax=Nocardioides marmoriginsengisoli TaxID=661483 RepID=A0A3N0CGS6_9ACTN|nr:flagellar hook-basal body complex protein FliE [Nocardioides marmoriginsengisoli]